MTQGDKTPTLRPNWYYLGPLSAIFAVTAVGSTMYMLRDFDSHHPGEYWLVLILWLAMWAGLLIGFARQVGTSMSPEGLRQRGLFGEKYIRWEEVVGVATWKGGLKIQSSNTWITFIPEFCQQPESILKFIRKQLETRASHLRAS